MEITTEIIKELRDKTGVSVMQCKKALEEANGDVEKAIAVLQQKSAEIAQKKGDRTLGAGVIESYIHNTKQVGVLVELLCETDFVAKNEEFVKIAKDIAMHVSASEPESVEALLEQDFIKNPELKIKNLLESAVQKFGEKIELSRFVRYSIG
jgi:elongation factor Ts